MNKGCPCAWGEPCHPRCTCINEFSSRGCSYCCSYGSDEQRQAKAAWLVARLKGVDNVAVEGSDKDYNPLQQG